MQTDLPGGNIMQSDTVCTHSTLASTRGVLIGISLAHHHALLVLTLAARQSTILFTQQKPQTLQAPSAQLYAAQQCLKCKSTDEK